MSPFHDMAPCVDLTSDNDDDEDSVHVHSTAAAGRRIAIPTNLHSTQRQGRTSDNARPLIPRRVGADARGRLPPNDYMAHPWPPMPGSSANYVIPRHVIPVSGFAEDNTVLLADGERHEDEEEDTAFCLDSPLRQNDTIFPPLTQNRSSPLFTRPATITSRPTHDTRGSEIDETDSDLIWGVKDMIARKANETDDIDEAKEICFREIMYDRHGGPTRFGSKWVKGKEKESSEDREGLRGEYVGTTGLHQLSSPARTTSAGTRRDPNPPPLFPIRRAAAHNPSRNFDLDAPQTAQIDLTDTISNFESDVMDSDEDEAEDLRRAIALSLEEEEQKKPSDLDAAIAACNARARENAREKQKQKEHERVEDYPQFTQPILSPGSTSLEMIGASTVASPSQLRMPRPPKKDVEMAERIETNGAGLSVHPQTQAQNNLASSTSGPADTIQNDRTVSASTASQQTKPSALASTSSSSTLSRTFNLMTLNRQQMEAERLARLKRKREGGEEGKEEASNKIRGREIARKGREQSKTVSISPPPLRDKGKDGSSTGMTIDRRGARKEVDEIPRSQPRQGKQELPTLTAATNSPKKTTISVSSPASAPISSSHPEPPYFPTGKVLQTFIAGFPTTNTISFPQVIGPKDTLTSCLLSSYIWDFDWLFPHFATTCTKFQLVMHAKWPAQRDALKEDFRGVQNVRLCFPPMDGIVNCMHSKLMLLFYDAEDIDVALAMSVPAGTNENTSTRWQGPRCRIVVPTANLIRKDWGVGGIMENTMFLIDLPVKGEPVSTTDSAEEPEETSFQKSLVEFLQAQTVPNDVIAKLEHFDFRNTSHLGFVHTIGGMHAGQSWRTTGLCGLGRIVTELGLANSTPLQLDFITSSVGSLNDEFMSSMYLAAQGDDGLTEYRYRTTGISKDQRVLGLGGRSGLTRGSATSATVTDDWRQNFRFYFPSDTTVKGSKGGPANAGTICFSRKWWENTKFPRNNMRDCVSLRDGCLMHNKLWLVRYTSPLVTQTGKTYLGWTYVGSANLSESAWGRLLLDKTTKSPKLNCRNWECGVVIPVPKEASQLSSNENASDEGLVMLGGIVPVPMKYPSDRFEGRNPWFFSEDGTQGQMIA